MARSWPLCWASRIAFAITYATLFDAASSRAVGGNGEGNTEVSARDLHSGRAKIIGYLGRPLGELITVRGFWYAPNKLAKDSSPIYRITRINGHALKQPIDLTHYRVRAVSLAGRS